MINWIKTQLKSTVEAVIQHIFLLVISGLVFFSVLTAWLTEKLNDLLVFLQLGTPIWVTIGATFFVAAYIHLLKSKIQSSNYSKHNIFLMEDSGFKWKITDKNNGDFSISSMPYCKFHDLQRVQWGQTRLKFKSSLTPLKLRPVDIERLMGDPLKL